MRKTVGGYSASPSKENYDKLLTEVVEDCTQEVRQIGSIIAKIFGPKNISSLGRRQYSFGSGSYGGDIHVDVETDELKMSYEIYIDLTDKLIFDTKIHKLLLEEVGCDQLEYSISSSLDIAKCFEFLNSNAYDVKEYDTKYVSAVHTKETQFSTHIETTTTGALIEFSSEDTLLNETIMKEIDPVRIQEILGKLV